MSADLPREMIITEALARDLNDVQEVHMAAFPGFFLSRMGGPFVRAYYATILSYPGGRIFAARHRNQVVGFVAVVMNPAAYYKHMASRRRALVIPTLLGVLRRPWLLPRVLYNRNRVRSFEAAAGLPAEAQCELTSIGVAPEAKQMGVGDRLMNTVLEFAIAEHARQITLTTDAEGNDGVNRFYLRQGYELAGTFVSGERRVMNLYRLRVGG